MRKEYEIIVLKGNLDLDEANKIVDKNKVKALTTFFREPKKDEIQVKSLKLFYEAYLILSGKYEANFVRKAMHTISVEPNVREVMTGDGIFPIKKNSGILGKLGSKMSPSRKNQVEIELEERVFIEREEKIIFDCHGNEMKFPYKLDSQAMEAYPKRVLNRIKENVKDPETKRDVAKRRLALKLKESMESGIRDLNEKIVIDQVLQVYVPIYEARLIGPRKKEAILRVDAVRNKVV